MNPTPNPDLSRRRLLRLMGATPMLPLGAGGVAALLSACGGGDAHDPPPASSTPAPAVTLASVSFSSMNAPALADAAAMARTTVGSTMTVNFSDASKLDFK